jgi:hypothetical protein
MLELVVNVVLLIKWRLDVSFFYILSSNFKSFLIGQEQHEANLLKAQKAERRALREKKALQKANQLADLASDGEGEYEARESPTVSYCWIYMSFLLIVSYNLVCLPRGS